MTAPLSKEVVLQRKIERLSMDNTSLRSMNRKLLRAGGWNVEGVVEELRSILSEDDNHPFIIAPSKYDKIKLLQKPPFNPEHWEVVALALSDWHLSETVNRADANGINAYSSTICANRAWYLSQTAKKIITGHACLYPIKKLWIPVLGDMINGSIHEEFRLTNDLSDPAASVLCARLMVGFLTELKSFGVPIQVDCVVGNHPRLTVKVPTKVQAQTTWDWVIYEWVADAFKDDKQVTVNVHTGQMASVDVVGWRYVIEHGIQWKNGDEEEFEDRIRALFDDPISRKATGLTGSAFDQIVIGNLHKPAFLERTVKNGALVGQNELGQGWRLKPIKAVQNMWGISKSHVRTWEYQLDISSVKDDRDSNPFVDYAKGFMKRHGR